LRTGIRALLVLAIKMRVAVATVVAGRGFDSKLHLGVIDPRERAWWR
jgi:hypothetical protein